MFNNSLHILKTLSLALFLVFCFLSGAFGAHGEPHGGPTATDLECDPTGCVGTDDIADNAVTNAKIADDAVTGDKVLDGSLTTIDISDGAGSGLDADLLDNMESQEIIDAARLWDINNGSDIFYNDGNVGIGVLDPQTALDVNGDITVDGIFFPDGTFQDTAAVDGGGDADWEIGNGVIFNDTDDVGIGTDNPLESFHVDGHTAITRFLTVGIGNDDIPGSAREYNLRVRGAPYEGARVRVEQESTIANTEMELYNIEDDRYLRIVHNGVGTSYGLGGGTQFSGYSIIHSNSANGLATLTESNTPLVFYTNLAERVRITGNGDVGIGTTIPNYPLEMGSGAHVTSGGVWTNASSREYKENIRELTAKEAVNALEELRPTRFNYKVDKEDEYLGFISEDVPELVASKDRKGLSPMDIVTVLAKVVQEQQKKIEELEAKINKM